VPTFTWEFTRHISAYARQVVVVAPHFRGAKRREQLAPNIRVERFRYALPSRFENLAYGQFVKSRWYLFKTFTYVVAEFWLTMRQLVKERPAVINAHWILPQGLVAVVVGKLFRVRTVITVHGSDIFMFNSRPFRWYKRLVLRHADEVVVNSSLTRDACRGIWPNRNYHIVPMGINVQHFKPGRRTTKRAGFHLLFVGRLEPIKGTIYLCQAFQQLHTQHPDASLTIIGDGSQRAALEHYIAKHNLQDAIQMPGWVQPGDLPGYYQQASVFVGPSIHDTDGRKEALGLVLAEAAASGLPVVATDIGGSKDIVEDGVTGRLVPEKNVRALVAALDYIYGHPTEAQAMGRRGRTRVLKVFPWPRVIERYREILGL